MTTLAGAAVMALAPGALPVSALEAAAAPAPATTVAGPPPAAIPAAPAPATTPAGPEGASSAAQVAAPGAGAVASQDDLVALYEGGVPFAEFLAAAVRRKEAWHRHYEQGDVADGLLERAASLSEQYRLLVVAEDWCGDSVNTVPYLARLVDAVEGLDMRIIDSRVGRRLMESHPTPDGRGATPTIVVLDARGREVGSLSERPAVLQDWWLSHLDVPQELRLERKYAWYDWDRGEHTLDELLAAMETAEGRR